MNVLQWIYTSSCWRMTRGSGYGTVSASEGLTEDDVRELETRCGFYDIPASAPYQPTPEELKKHFPVVFSSFRLTSGKKVLCRVHYLGQGWHDPRWGNFFSHALVLTDGEWPTHAMNYYDSSAFWCDLPEEMKNKALKMRDGELDWEPFPAMPALPLKDIPVTTEMSDADTKELLTGNEFSAMAGMVIANLFDPANVRRPLSVEYRRGYTAKLFSIVFQQLPYQIANTFTFSTCLSVQGKSTQLLESFSLIGTDATDANLSGNSDVKSYVLDAVRFDPSGYREFVVNFDAISLEDLEVFSALFLFCFDKSAKLNSEMIDSGITFAVRHGKKQVWNDISRAILNFRQANVSVKNYGTLCKKAFEWEKENPDIVAREELLGFFVHVIVRLCANGEARHAAECFDALERASGGDACQCWLDSDNLEQLPGVLTADGVTSKDAVSLCVLTLRVCDKIGSSPEKLDLDHPDLVKEITVKIVGDSDEWGRILSAAGEIKPAFTGELWKWQIKYAPNAINGEILKRFLDALPWEQACDARNRIAASGMKGSLDSLFQELTAHLSHPKNSIVFLQRYSEDVFAGNKAYMDAYFGRALQAIDIRSASKASWDWYLEQLHQIKDDKALDSLVQSISNELSLDPPNKNNIDIIRKLCVIRKTMKGTTGPGVPELLLWGDHLANNTSAANDLIAAEIEKYSIVVHSLSQKGRQTLLGWLMPMLFNECRTPGAHQKLLTMFDSGDNTRELAKAYVREGIRVVGKGKAGFLDSRVASMLECCLECVPEGKLTKILCEEMADGLFLKFKKEDFLTLQNKLNFFGKLPIAAKRRWAAMVESVNQYNQSGLMKRTFTRIFKSFRR